LGNLKSQIFNPKFIPKRLLLKGTFDLLVLSFPGLFFLLLHLLLLALIFVLFALVSHGTPP
jgi:hypothetical protein